MQLVAGQFDWTTTNTMDEIPVRLPPRSPEAARKEPAQPHRLTSVMQMAITAAALCVAAAAIMFTVWTAREQRNAALVQIGIAVLRADPQKEPQVTAARDWALDLIDANAGGVKFSAEARNELRTKRLNFEPSGGTMWGGDDLSGGNGDWKPVLSPPKSIAPQK